MSNLSTAPHRAYSYNAAFSYNGTTMKVNVTNFQYAWKLAMSGKASTRQGQTAYPKRVEQSGLSVNLVFRDQQAYLDFGKFVRGYHLSVTSMSNPPAMQFTMYGWAMGAVGELTYGVILSDFPITMRHDMDPAPTVNGLQLELIQNNIDMWETNASSVTNGSYKDLAAGSVTSGDVASSGSGAFK
jgi:hypothetical protein